MDILTLCRLACSDTQIKNTFGGVFSSDLLPKRIEKFSTFIVNLDPHTMSGSHWIALKFNATEKSVRVFDSYGKPPTNKNILDFCRRNANSVYYNDVCFQSAFTNTCGHFCLYFLYCSTRFLNLDELSRTNKKQNEKFIASFVRLKFKKRACCQFSYHRKQKCTALINMRISL